MPQYSDDQAHAVFARDMDDVHAYYHQLAQQHQPAVERAIANLTGQQPVASAPTTTEPDEDVDDTPDTDEDVAEDDLPEEPPEA
jgi:hypothetical protein